MSKRDNKAHRPSPARSPAAPSVTLRWTLGLLVLAGLVYGLWPQSTSTEPVAKMPKERTKPKTRRQVQVVHQADEPTLEDSLDADVYEFDIMVLLDTLQEPEALAKEKANPEAWDRQVHIVEGLAFSKSRGDDNPFIDVFWDLEAKGQDALLLDDSPGDRLKVAEHGLYLAHKTGDDDAYDLWLERGHQAIENLCTGEPEPPDPERPNVIRLGAVDMGCIRDKGREHLEPTTTLHDLMNTKTDDQLSWSQAIRVAVFSCARALTDGTYVDLSVKMDNDGTGWAWDEWASHSEAHHLSEGVGRLQTCAETSINQQSKPPFKVVVNLEVVGQVGSAAEAERAE